MTEEVRKALTFEDSATDRNSHNKAHRTNQKIKDTKTIHPKGTVSIVENRTGHTQVGIRVALPTKSSVHVVKNLTILQKCVEVSRMLIMQQYGKKLTPAMMTQRSKKCIH